MGKRDDLGYEWPEQGLEKGKSYTWGQKSKKIVPVTGKMGRVTPQTRAKTAKDIIGMSSTKFDEYQKALGVKPNERR